MTTLKSDMEFFRKAGETTSNKMIQAAIGQRKLQQCQEMPVPNGEDGRLLREQAWQLSISSYNKRQGIILGN